MEDKQTIIISEKQDLRTIEDQDLNDIVTFKRFIPNEKIDFNVIPKNKFIGGNQNGKNGQRNVKKLSTTVDASKTTHKPQNINSFLTTGNTSGLNIFNTIDDSKIKLVNNISSPVLIKKRIRDA